MRWNHTAWDSPPEPPSSRHLAAHPRHCITSPDPGPECHHPRQDLCWNALNISIQNAPEMETTQISIHRWLNQQNGEQAHDGIWPTYRKVKVVAPAGQEDKPWKHDNMPNTWTVTWCLIPFDRSPVILDGPVIKESACWCRRCNRRRFDPWSRKWQPTPPFWSGEFHGQGSLVGSLWSQRYNWTQSLHIPASCVWGSCFSACSFAFRVLLICIFASDRWVVIPPCSFITCFPNGEWCWIYFHVLHLNTLFH